MIYQFIDENKDIFGLRWLFRHFNMTPNAYYNYLKGNKDGYRNQKQEIYEEIKRKKTSENKPLQKSKPCTKSYSGIKKKLTDRTPTDLTKAEIKGRDDRPITSKIALSTHSG